VNANCRPGIPAGTDFLGPLGAHDGMIGSQAPPRMGQAAHSGPVKAALEPLARPALKPRTSSAM
jgi:hypothetical protein